MDIERKIVNKEKNINPTCIKDNNLNYISLFDSSFKSKRRNKLELLTRLKRNNK